MQPCCLRILVKAIVERADAFQKGISLPIYSLEHSSYSVIQRGQDVDIAIVRKIWLLWLKDEFAAFDNRSIAFKK
jgi:hypothetical protein